VSAEKDELVEMLIKENQDLRQMLKDFIAEAKSKVPEEKKDD